MSADGPSRADHDAGPGRRQHLGALRKRHWRAGIGGGLLALGLLALAASPAASSAPPMSPRMLGAAGLASFTSGPVRQLPRLTSNASGPVTIGATIQDTGSLTESDAATGTITFALFGPADETCSRPPTFTSAVPVHGDGAYQSAPATPHRPGLYEWTANYSGDAANVPVPGVCPSAGGSSVVLVAIANLTTTTAQVAVPTGASISDAAVLTGGFAPTGEITFEVFGPGDAACARPPVFTSASVTVSGNGTYRSGGFTPAAPGTYYFEVAYSGDADNLARSVPCGITTQTTSVTPVLDVAGQPPEPTSVGNPIAASETFAGGIHPTGSIIFTIYGPDDPSCSATPAFRSPAVIVNGDGTYRAAFVPVAPGTYDIVASYSGDANNAPTTTLCGATNETFTVSRAIPTIVATSEIHGLVGRPITTEESISGGLHPTGSVTFTFYRPNDTTCTQPPLLTSGRQKVNGDGAYRSPPFTPTSDGDYRFIVSYSGDSQNIPLTTDCNGTNQALLIGISGLYDPNQHPKDVINLEVVAFALLALAGPAAGGRAPLATSSSNRSGAAAGGASSGGGTGATASGSSSNQGSVVSTGVDNTSEGWEAVTVLGAATIKELGASSGDRSPTWHWPGTRRVDKVSVAVPRRVAPVSPLVARIANDAGYLRAILGSASIVFPITGIVLALIAVSAVHGQATPPPFVLAMALAVLGVLDAMAGIVAVSVFVLAVAAHGGLATAADVRTLLGLSTLWFAAPIVAGVARPLRRAPTRSTAEHVERLADVIVAALAGAWAVQSIISGLPGLSGKSLPIAAHANSAALVVLAGMGVRMVIETIAAHHYPLRLAEVQPAELPRSGNAQHLVSGAFAVAVFLFVALPYVGPSWELYVGGVFFAVPIVLKRLAQHLPNLPKLYAILPRGVLATVTMLVIGTAFGALVAQQLNSSNNTLVIRESFLLLSLPGLVISLLQLFGREGPDPPKIHWVPEKVLGAAVVTLGTLVVVGVVKI